MIEMSDLHRVQLSWLDRLFSISFIALDFLSSCWSYSPSIYLTATIGEVLFGCIYDPFRNEIFTAWEGQGAFLNGNRISCCSTSELKSAVVCTGSPPNLASLAACLRGTNLISAEVRTVRMLGRWWWSRTMNNGDITHKHYDSVILHLIRLLKLLEHCTYL